MTPDLWYLEEIRDAVNSPETADPDLLREAAIAYADACRDANKRLRETDDLLKRGFRTEAIHLSEREPNLLELLAELDFPLLEEWQGMLAQWGIELPPPLQIETAVRLNAAYAEQLPLEALLRNHRKLALARAPLPARLHVLRQIRRRDPTNTAWAYDIEQYERTRLKQIDADLAAAARREDLATLGELTAELRSADWSWPVPPELVDGADQQYSQVQAVQSRRVLQSLLPQMDQAHSEFDVTRAGLLADQWHKYASHAALAPSEPLAQRAAPFLQWLDEQQRIAAERRAFEKSLALLEKALDQDVSQQKLEKLYHKAQRFDQPLPPTLETRVRDRLGAIQLHGRRRFALVGMLAVLLLALGGMGLFLYWQQHQFDRAVAEHAATLGGLLEQDSLRDAEAYYNRLADDLQRAPAIEQLVAQLRQSQRDEQARIRQFDELWQRAEQMSLDQPDHALIGQLNELAKLRAERSKLEALQLQIAQRQRELQEERDAEFTEMLEPWVARLAKLDARDVLADELREDRLWAMVSQLRADLDRHRAVSAPVLRQGDALLDKARAIANREAALTAQRRELDSVFRAVGRADAYADALRRFIEKFPNAPVSNDLKRVLEEEHAWRAALAWSDFWKECGDDWKQLTPGQAAEILQRGDDLVKEHHESDLNADYLERKPFLTRVADRQSVDLAALRAFLLSNALINDVWMVMANDGTRYYCPDEPEVSGSPLFTYFADVSLRRAERSLGRQNLAYLGVSPQSQLVRGRPDEEPGIGHAMRNLTDSNWDGTFYRMAETVRRAATAASAGSTDGNGSPAPELDPVLAMDMLRRILKTGCEGSYLFHHAFGSIAEEIENSGVDLSVSWFLPEDEHAETARLEARAVLAGLPAFRSLTQRTSREEGFRAKPPPSNLHWMASLEAQPDDSLICRPALGESASGELCVALVDTPGRSRLQAVADVEGGRVHWRPDASAVLRAGQPLFLRSP